MDARRIDRVFRQLFAHRPCASCARHGIQRTARQPGLPPRRYYNKHRETDSLESKWQQRTAFALDKSDEYKRVPMVTANSLRASVKRPRRVKMLMRDFIEDSLYNPSYGYFSKNATIFSPGKPFDFQNLEDDAAFNQELGMRYTEMEDALDEKQPDDNRQLWHTPTEIFRPHYGEAIARYLVSNYKLTLYPYHDLLIYEMGAGNGTFMLNVLDYIRQTDPEVYARTQYHIIEVSANLAGLQANQLKATASSRGHADKVTIINKSIFDWTDYRPSPCFFLALEVFDNFAHDKIRYSGPDGKTPLQATVLIDSVGDFYEFLEPRLDPIAERYLSVRAKAGVGSGTRRLHGPERDRRWWHAVRERLMPFQYTVGGSAEYIPTRLMQFFDVLREYFPAHRLVASDFHALPNAVEGFCAPVVQTRWKRRMVPVSTPLVHQGYFDILFPTDFDAMEDVYRALTGKLTRVSTHEDFIRRWAFVEDTTTKSGENPLLSWYQNASFITTV